MDYKKDNYERILNSSYTWSLGLIYQGAMGLRYLLKSEEEKKVNQYDRK